MLKYTDGKCDHEADNSPPLPEVSLSDQADDVKKMKERFKELQASTDPRAKLLCKCLNNNMKWAGSSFIEFVSKGTEGLLNFLSETKQGSVTLAHDVDLYRSTDDDGKLGKRFVGTQWDCPQPKTAGAVRKFSLTLKANGQVRLDVDEVNLYRSSMLPSTDLWPHVCASKCNGQLQVDNLFPGKGPPLALSLHNALQIGGGIAVECYVLRRQAMPLCDENGVLYPMKRTAMGASEASYTPANRANW